MWSDITAAGDENDLELDRPQVIVEPDVRDAVKMYFRAMELTKVSDNPNKRATFGLPGSAQDTGKSNLWRDDVPFEPDATVSPGRLRRRLK